jgi:hypothetical protein
MSEKNKKGKRGNIAKQNKRNKQMHIPCNRNVFNNALADYNMYLGHANNFQSIINFQNHSMINNIQGLMNVSFNKPYKLLTLNKLDTNPKAIKIFNLMTSKITKGNINELKSLISISHVKFIKKYIINGKWEESDKGDSIVLFRLDNESIILSIDTHKYSYKVIKKLI